MQAPRHSWTSLLLQLCSGGPEQQFITALLSSADTSFADVLSVDTNSDVGHTTLALLPQRMATISSTV